jgi:hypothetical protein
LALVRAELEKEHVNFDEHARRDELRIYGEREALPPIERGKVRDNVTNTDRGNAAGYLAARLQRDHPEIAKRLADGEFKSVRQAWQGS